MNRTLRPRNPGFFLILAICCIPGCVSTQTPVTPAAGQSLEAIGKEELDLAVNEYQQENYSQAIRSLMDLIQRYPGAPILAEAQWMLAKSYEAQRDYPQALEEYQLFMRNYPESEHLYEAKLRTDVLKRTVRPTVLPDFHGRTRAVQFTSPDFIGREAFESMIQILSKSGIDTLIIPASQSTNPLPGIFFKSALAPVIQDFLGPALSLAHDYRMRVFVSMPLREMPWLKDTKWLDLKSDPVSGSLETTQRLNLWNPAVQNYILALYGDLAAYPLDGLIIEEPVGYSETEGLNEIALEQFNNDFGLSLTPSQLYTDARSKPAFWRWTGWKNRQVMAVLGYLVHELHLKQPHLKVGLGMSKEAIVLPREALVKYGQDLLEATQAGFDFFVFSWPPKTFRPGDTGDTLKRLNEFVPNREKIILRIDPEKPVDPDDLPETAGFSLVFIGRGNPSEWVQRLPSELLPARSSP